MTGYNRHSLIKTYITKRDAQADGQVPGNRLIGNILHDNKNNLRR